MRNKSTVIAKHRSRKFLNPRFGLASIQISAHMTQNDGKDREGKPYRYHYLSASVTIRDCSETARLEFDAGDEKSRKERLKKVDLLISELQKLREVIDSTEMIEERYDEL